MGCEVWGVGFELWGLPVRQRLFGQLRHLHDVLIPGHSLHVGHANGAQNVAPALPPSGEHCLRRGARAWYEEAWLCRACVCARACVLTVSARAATHTHAAERFGTAIMALVFREAVRAQDTRTTYACQCL